MALTNKPRGRFWSQLHFLLRLLGLTGLLAAGVGLVLAHAAGLLPAWSDSFTWDAVRDYARSVYDPTRAILDAALAGTPDPDRLKVVAVALVVVGTPFALLALLVEALAGLRFAAARRGAFGTNAAVQVALALAVLVGVNVYANREGNYRRFDLTHDHLFTLPDSLQQQLRELKGETTIVVYQMQKTAGFLADNKADSYDDAAERKVTEKVEDLVEQFRALGPRFKVVVLDTRDVNFKDQEAALPKELRGAIDKAPENSIFFAADGKVQRLAFNDFYALDKAASQGADGGRGNLVLRYQGPEPFAAKVLNIEQKRPRVAIAVTHELLTTEGKSDEYTLAGVRKALADRGFETRDLILKKWRSRRGPPEAVVYTPDESRYERLADSLTVLGTQINFFEAQLDRWKKATAADLKQQGFNEETRAEQVEGLTSLLEQGRKKRDLIAAEQKRLQVESLAEQRRLTDVRAKMGWALADCDLLILPRMTLRDITNPPFNIPNEVHRIDDAQVAAIEDFIKSGKPVLACLGSVNEPSDEGPPPVAGPDGVEGLLEQLGFKLSKQTVVFDSEIGALAEYQAALQGKRDIDLMSRGDESDIPPLLLGRPGEAKSADENPLARSLRLTADGLGKGQELDLRVRHPRPLSFEAKGGQPTTFDAAFLLTDPRSWNEDQPFPTEKDMPNYTDAKKRGPTPVGLAAEVTVPSDWYGKGEAPAEPRTARVVVIGDGGLFVGPSLSPAREKLLLDTCNWALGRDDQLTQEGRRWEYPRVRMTPREQSLWTWGTLAGLPVLCVFFGLVVVLWRRLR